MCAFPPGEASVGKLTLRHQRFDDALWHGTIAIPDVIFCIHTWVRASVSLSEIRACDLRHRYATIQIVRASGAGVRGLGTGSATRVAKFRLTRTGIRGKVRASRWQVGLMLLPVRRDHMQPWRNLSQVRTQRGLREQ